MGGVTDTEMVKLCALAMELEVADDFSGMTPPVSGVDVYSKRPPSTLLSRYDPLRDDAQAMALVKRFTDMSLQHTNDRYDEWTARHYPTGTLTRSKSLNHAIVECCARMQAAKQQTPSVSEHGEGGT